MCVCVCVCVCVCRRTGGGLSVVSCVYGKGEGSHLHVMNCILPESLWQVGSCVWLIIKWVSITITL